MKRVTTVLIVLTGLLMASPANAQFGIRGGINLTDFFSDSSTPTDGARGLNLGVALTVIKLGPINIVAEGYYAEKGTDQNAIGLTPENLLGLENPEQLEALLEQGGTLEYGLDYFELPILARINLPVKGALRPYLNAGPTFAWQIDCGFKVNAVSQSSNFDCADLERDNLRETLEDYEMGLVIGGGLDFPVLSRGGINLDVRYNRGLSRLATLDDGGDVKNSAFTAMLGYFIGL